MFDKMLNHFYSSDSIRDDGDDVSSDETKSRQIVTLVRHCLSQCNNGACNVGNNKNDSTTLGMIFTDIREVFTSAADLKLTPLNVDNSIRKFTYVLAIEGWGVRVVPVSCKSGY